MFKHALFTGLLVVVASVLGAVAAQMNESSQSLMAASNGSSDMEFVVMMVPHQGIGTQKQEIEQYKKWQPEHM